MSEYPDTTLNILRDYLKLQWECHTRWAAGAPLSHQVQADEIERLVTRADKILNTSVSLDS